jgi:enoyl-CoA hydratase/carnithine racemase
VVPHDTLLDEAHAMAAMLAQKPPRALALAKRAVYASGDASLAEVLDRELAHQLECFQTTDAREGLAAFLEKRPPRFTGS